MSKLISESKSLISALPHSVVRDKVKEQLAEVVADELVQMVMQAENAAVFPNVEKLPEGVLDILAYDFAVAWYDYSGTVEEKRKTIRECLMIHRCKGTKYAVETALKSVYDTVRVREWWEYGGEPFHFKVVIYDHTNDVEKRSRIMAKVMYYKNARSVLEETIFHIGLKSSMSVFAGIKGAGIHKKIESEVMNYGVE